MSRPLWVLVTADSATCTRCRASKSIAGPRAPGKPHRWTQFYRAHEHCSKPAKLPNPQAPGPVPSEPFIDRGTTVQEILGHACEGGTHLSRLPASSSGFVRRRASR